jgi:inosine/xanthosine triphosphatase
MKVGIGTKNLGKVKAVEETFRKAFGEVEFISAEVDSGVPSQPKEGEILKGAINRAKNSIKDNDYGVGIEGGVVNIEGRMFATGYCVIIDRQGNYTIGSQPIFELPRIFAERISKGDELGRIADDFFKSENLKHGIGAVGMLSKKFVTREDLIKSSVSTALIPLISKKVYSE